MSRKQDRNVDPLDPPTTDVFHEDGRVIVRVPVKFYRRNGRQTILTESDAAHDQQIGNGKNHALIANLAKAYLWQEQLESGEFNSLDELARVNRLDRTYVGRMLQLTSLSPQFVEMILSGNKSDWISLRQLHKGIPKLWSHQLECCVAQD